LPTGSGEVYSVTALRRRQRNSLERRLPPAISRYIGNGVKEIQAKGATFGGVATGYILMRTETIRSLPYAFDWRCH
jgi:hypothetical protein